eukprot:SAG22_NODE_2267_length_2763_cov_3.832584_1_plen_143_part_00
MHHSSRRSGSARSLLRLINCCTRSLHAGTALSLPRTGRNGGRWWLPAAAAASCRGQLPRPGPRAHTVHHHHSAGLLGHHHAAAAAAAPQLQQNEQILRHCAPPAPMSCAGQPAQPGVHPLRPRAGAARRCHARRPGSRLRAG